MKATEILNWKDSYYTGKAIKMGAGVQGWEAMAAAKAKGLVALGGECPTVSFQLIPLCSKISSAFEITNFILTLASYRLVSLVVTLKVEVIQR